MVWACGWVVSRTNLCVWHRSTYRVFSLSLPFFLPVCLHPLFLHASAARLCVVAIPCRFAPIVSSPGSVDYDALDLRPFLPGAVVRMPASSPSATSPSAFHLLADPLRAPSSLPAVLTAPVGSLGDKARVGALRLSTLLASPEGIAAAADGAPSTAAYLTDTCGFSPAFVRAFFRPFYRGIFLSDLDKQS